ncbi:Possible purine/pyrimidine phosphoribosyltransferase [hydrothermal vent metagenome]|uniref:Possible purine/pyrimidine phosphoribosyltransferase n=1 Tax=hydrothermal vent metagenome TaxID=652676 RepID=A0A1W1D5E5_9ZZZZ
MKCLLCEEFSLSHICKNCQKNYLTPSLYKRKITDNIEVVSFYEYSSIKDLIHTKHTDIGFYIYNILAQNSFKKFGENFHFVHQVASIGVDDTPKYGYSHTAILNKYLKSNFIHPLYNKLRAKNNISYANKSKEFRQTHPRDFVLQTFVEQDVILVDDIITTGSTLSQAINTLKQANKNPLLCLTLADASS